MRFQETASYCTYYDDREKAHLIKSHDLFKYIVIYHFLASQ